MMRSIIPLVLLTIALPAPANASQTIAVPTFNTVELRGGGELLLVPGPVQQVILVEGSNGLTQFHVDRTGKLRIDACNGNCPRNYRLRLEIRSPHVPAVSVNGGGSIRSAAGFAPQRELAAGISGGGRIDLRTVEARTVAAGINGGGLILVRPRATLAAGVNGGGEVRYLGNPQVTTAIHGGGWVRRDN
jgi:hypothetical protein